MSKPSAPSQCPDNSQSSPKPPVFHFPDLFSQAHLPIKPILVCQRTPRQEGKNSLLSGEVCANFAGQRAGRSGGSPSPDSSKRGNQHGRLCREISNQDRGSRTREPDRDRKSTRLNSSHIPLSRMPSSA